MAIKEFIETKRFKSVHQTYDEAILGLFDVWNETNRFNNYLDCYNDTSHTLNGIMEEARQNGMRLRAYGSKWSLSKAPHTDGWLINTKPLNLRFRLNTNHLSNSFSRDHSNLYFIQCGNTIQEINTFLAEDQKSLRTSGASNGQTIAGALSTGTHGAAFKFGAIQDFVVGLHILTGEGQGYYLERASDSIINDAFAADINAQRLRSDDLFNSALVSFGSFGFIHGVMIEAIPFYKLKVATKHYNFNEIREVMNTLDFSNWASNPFDTIIQEGEPYHFNIIINPYKKNKAYIKAMSKIDGNIPSDLPQDSGVYGRGEDLPHFFGAISDRLPSIIPTVINPLIESEYKEEMKIGSLGEIFSTTTYFGKVVDAGIGINAADTESVLQLYYELLADYGNVAAIISLRYVKGSEALMAFTRFEKTCVFEIAGVASKRMRRFLEKFWTKLRQSRIEFTQHWGKTNDLYRSTPYCYGAQSQKWIDCRSRFLTEEKARIFSSPFLESCGLDTYVPNLLLEDILV